MSKDVKDFEISKLLDLTRKNKYATTVAAFEIIEMMDQLAVPRKLFNRKPAVKAMSMLSDELINWEFISEEQRVELDSTISAMRRSANSNALDAVFSTEGSSAPVSDDSDEDLDEIVDTEPVEQLIDDSDSDLSMDDDDEDEEEEEEEEEADDEEDEEEEEAEPEDDDEEEPEADEDEEE